MFAGAEEDGLCLGCFEREGEDATAVVGAVAEGLRFAPAAGTPVVAVAGFDGDGNGGFLRDDGF